MAWELLAGAHPFAGRSSVPAMIAAHIAEAPPSLATRRPDVPKALTDVVMRCLEKDAARRPQSAAELLGALDGVVTPSSETVVAVGALPRRGRARIAGAAALVMLVAAGLWALSRRAPTAPSGVSSPTSLAVLPFEVSGGDTANAWFAEGIADELTTALARVPELRLAGRRSAARFSGRTSSVQEIGQALDVGAVLEGSVRRADDRIRVSAELTSATDGRVLWSETYERGAKDVFAVQDDIARAIVGALRVRLGGGVAPGAMAARGTTDLEAYDLYLRGLYLYRRRGAGLADARALFEQAIARDPGFARAHAALASTLLTTPYFLPVRMAAVLPPARAAAERALGLADSLADAHAAMGYVLAESFDWPRAEAEYRRAIALDPAGAEPLYRLGNLLVVTGRADEAIPVLESLRDRDPLYSVAASFLAASYAWVGREADALAEGRRALALEPNGLPQLWILSVIYDWAGQRDSAAALARRKLTLTRAPARIGLAAMILADAGDRAAAEAVTRQIEATPPGLFGREAGLMHAYLGLGDTARALDAMERAAAGDGDLLYTSITSLFLAGEMQPLRDNARFLAVLERYHLDPERFYRRSTR
jgi:serine/threonine-protein kinase